MKFAVTKEDRKLSRIPHEIFLTNLVVNHLLFFVALLEMTVDYPILPVVSPVISLVVLVYTIIKGERMIRTAPWFVANHWRIAVQRSRLLMWLLITMLIVSGIAWTLYDYVGLDMVTVFPLAAVSAIPAMVSIVVLVIMESDAMHLACHGELSDGTVKRFPPPTGSEFWKIAQPLLEEEEKRKAQLEQERAQQQAQENREPQKS